MLIENISPQMDSDCTRLTRVDHTVSISTRGEYGALSMARAAGGLEAVPVACNARICSVAAPFHQCSTHGLPGLQSKTTRLKEQLQLAHGHSRKKESLSAVERPFLQCTQPLHFDSCATCGVGACLRSVLAPFFGVAKTPTHCECNASPARSARRRPALSNR